MVRKTNVAQIEETKDCIAGIEVEEEEEEEEATIREGFETTPEKSATPLETSANNIPMSSPAHFLEAYRETPETLVDRLLSHNTNCWPYLASFSLLK